MHTSGTPSSGSLKLRIEVVPGSDEPRKIRRINKGNNDTLSWHFLSKKSGEGLIINRN